MHHKKLETFSLTAQDHAVNPRNHGPLKNFDTHVRFTGPCGDTMEFWLSARDKKIARISFITDGCRSSIACGSMATILAEGKPIEAAAAVQQEEILDALGGLPTGFEHCALLAANALKTACEQYLNRQKAP